MTVNTLENLTFRPYQEEDLDPLIEIMKASRIKQGEPPLVNRDEMRHQVSNPLINWERDTKVALDGDRLIALNLAAMLPTGQAFGVEIIHPDYADGPLREHFVRTGEDMIRARFDEIAEPAPVYIHRNAREDRTDRLDLYAKLGYVENRRFYEMKIDFGEETISAPDLPDGIELRPFDPEQHAKAAWQAHQESFRDHFGHVRDTPYEEWSRELENPTFDPNLWLMAWDGDEIAGVAFNRVDTSEEKTGHVNILGVRRAWRKRGLGGALLRHTFHMFQAQGYEHVNLGVDAASKTNAVALYENAGMYVNECMVSMRKVLRGDEADIKD